MEGVKWCSTVARTSNCYSACPAQKAMNLSEEQHASLRDARRQLLTQTQTLRRQRAHLLQQLNTPLPGDSDVLNTEALSQVRRLAQYAADGSSDCHLKVCVQTQ